MKTIQSGSALILVIIISGILVSAITALWRSSLLRTDIAYLREQSYRQMYSAHAFARLAATICKKEYNECYKTLEDIETIVLACQAWPLTTDITCHAHVYAQRSEHGIALRTTLTCNQKVIHTVYCLVYLRGNQQGDEHIDQAYNIAQWHDAFG